MVQRTSFSNNFSLFQLENNNIFTNNICRIHTTWTGQICLRFGSFQDKLDCPDGMVSIQQIIFGEKKTVKNCNFEPF